MNIHEYQSKQVLREFGVNVPNGLPAFTVDEAVANAEKLSTPVIVVKAQIHAGGRGKAGGVKIAKNKDEVRAYAQELLGKTLVTGESSPIQVSFRIWHTNVIIGAVVLVLVLIAVIAFLIWRRRKGSEPDEEPQLLDGPVIDVKAEEKH